MRRNVASQFIDNPSLAMHARITYRALRLTLPKGCKVRVKRSTDDMPWDFHQLRARNTNADRFLPLLSYDFDKMKNMNETDLHLRERTCIRTPLFPTDHDS